MMKIFAYFQNVDEAHYSVFVSSQLHANDGWQAAVVENTKNLFDGFRLALESFIAGQFEMVKLDSVHVTLLGEVIDGDVSISHHKMFLVEANERYWLANNMGQLAKLRDLESRLQSYLGTATCVFNPVGDEYMPAVVRNNPSIVNLCPQIVVVMEDGNPVGVQLFGLPTLTRVTVVDVIHPDSVRQFQDEALFDLVHQNGTVKKNVRNVTPAVEQLNTFSQVAKLI
jgi:hypothetical protein